MYIEKIINLSTGKETIRAYSSDEVAEAKKGELEAEARTEQSKIANDLRASALMKLAALGLTEDEIAAL